MTYLTYDDIQLVPAFSGIKSRQSIDLTTNLSKNYTISIPIVGSPMDTVCESEMAFKLYQLGGVGCIHRFNKIIEQYTEIQKLCEKISATGKWSATIPIMAAIGVQEDDKKRAKMLIKAGANVLLIDVAHGDHQNVIDMTKWCKDNLPSHVDIIAGNIATADTLKATSYLDLNVIADAAAYTVDELVVGQTSGAQAYVVEIDASNGYRRYHQNDKTGYKVFTNGEDVVGQTSSKTGALASSNAVGNPEVDRSSGEILFLENRDPISRTTTQIEDIKVIIEF